MSGKTTARTDMPAALTDRREAMKTIDFTR
jgi:hypothetical protein